MVPRWATSDPVKTAFAPYEADVLETFDWLTDSKLSHGPLVTHVDGAGSRSGNSVALRG